MSFVDFGFLVVVFLCAYICGLFPSGPLLAQGGLGRFFSSKKLGSKKLAGKKLTEVGSGGTGATNVLRSVGPLAAAIVLVLDFSKAVLALLLVEQLAQYLLKGGDYFISLSLAVALVGCLCGHCFPIWSRGLRGGKGVASAAGLLFVLLPGLLAWALLLWVGVFLFLGYSSAASLSAGLLVLFATIFWVGKPIAWGLALGVAIVIFRHKENIVRLWRGEEKRLYDWKKRQAR